MSGIGPDQIVKAVLFFIPFLFSLCFHEYAHGWMAKRKGDNTAEIMGRLTLNPMAHIDWLGTVILPLMAILFHMPLFGWAKPVPVNSRNLNKPKDDMFWIALAGPVSNILLFVVGVFAWALLERQSVIAPTVALRSMLEIFLLLNLFLAFFNLLPLHPLDGGKIISRFIPISWDMWLEKNQYQLNMVLLLLVIFGGFRIIALPVYWIVGHAIELVVM